MDVSRCGATGSQLTSSGTLGDDFPTAAAVQYVASASRPPPWKGRTPAAVGRRLGGRGTETTSNPEPLMLRAMGIGAGYHAPQETAAALQALRPHMFSEGQAFFENLGRTSAQTGGEITSEQLQEGMGHLESAARARDQQDAPTVPNTTSAPAA